MTPVQAYLPPTLMLVALSYLVALLILITRTWDLVGRKTPTAAYEDAADAAWPPWIMRPTRQLANLFEFPVLYYALVAIALAVRLSDPLSATLAWVYVGFRSLHAISHLWGNRLWLRTPAFMIGNIVLLVMWGRLACELLFG